MMAYMDFDIIKITYIHDRLVIEMNRYLEEKIYLV